MSKLELGPVRHLSGSLRLPGSKSITNRALLLAGLAEGTTDLHQPLQSDDTSHMVKALQALGCRVDSIPKGYRVHGLGGPFPSHDGQKPLSLFLGNAGTAMRPLTAALTLTRPGQRNREVHLCGEPRMYERPIDNLVDALSDLGAEISYLNRKGFPPLSVRNSGLNGGEVRVRGDRSSQFLTALLMVAPLAKKPVSIKVVGELTSKPYIEITLALMECFGVTASRSDDLTSFEVKPASYRSPETLSIEGDATAASYFLAGGAITGGPVRVEGVGRPALQGDVAFADVLAAMGAEIRHGTDWIEASRTTDALTAVDMDLNHIPDAAMTLATTALFAKGITRIRNIGNWRIKETDRLNAMAIELKKLGASVDTTDQSITIRPPARLRSATIGTWNDHRMAMSFSLAALGPVGIRIQNPECVDKTFPEYFRVFSSLCDR